MRKSLAGCSRTWWGLLATFVLLFGMGSSARLSAQVVGGTLSGTVTDPSAPLFPTARWT